MEIQRVSQESYWARESNAIQTKHQGSIAFPTPFQLHQYQCAFAEDGSHLMFELITKDNMTLGFPLTAQYAKQMGSHLIEWAEKLEQGYQPGGDGSIQ